jgi:hypothetical protein
MGISCKFSSSFLSRKGILTPAFPIRTFGFLLRPEIMTAVSGDAFTYPDIKIIIKIRIIGTIIGTINI